MMKDVISQCNDKGIKITIEDSVYNYLAENGYDEKYGARPLRQLIQKKIEDELAELFLLRKIGEGSNVQVVLDNKGEITII